MQIRLLCENLATDMVWQAEWGFSALITYNDTEILFDTGYSDVWQRNAKIAGIDLNTADILALSHFHRDHTRGLLHHNFSAKKPLVCHPRVLTAVLNSKNPQTLKDYANIQTILTKDFDVTTTTGPHALATGAWFLGEIPRVTDFEKGTFFEDPMPDDTALAFETPKGCVVVTGCSHAGIANICEYAKKITNQPLYAVIGGFHLMHEEEPDVPATIDYFRAQAPEHLYPMHCIDFEYQAQMHNALNTPRRGAGDVITL